MVLLNIVVNRAQQVEAVSVFPKFRDDAFELRSIIGQNVTMTAHFVRYCY